MPRSPFTTALRVSWMALAFFTVFYLGPLIETYEDFAVELPAVPVWVLTTLDMPGSVAAVSSTYPLADTVLRFACHHLRFVFDALLVAIPIAAIALCYVPLIELWRSLS